MKTFELHYPIIQALITTGISQHLPHYQAGDATARLLRASTFQFS